MSGRQGNLLSLLKVTRAALVTAIALSSWGSAQVASDPLPSWNDGASKKAVLEFISRPTSSGSKDFVLEDERIATFDNDGTLWVEQPMYTQMAFLLDRVKQLAPAHPEWKDQPPFKAVLDGNLNALAASGERGL